MATLTQTKKANLSLTNPSHGIAAPDPVTSPGIWTVIHLDSGREVSRCNSFAAAQAEASRLDNQGMPHRN